MWLESKTVNLFLPNFHDHSKLIPLKFFYLVLLLSLTLSLPRFSTACCTILMMLVLRIWCWINWKIPQLIVFIFSHNFSALYCVYIVRGNSVLVMYGSLRVCWMLQMSRSSFGSSYLKVTCKL